MEIEIITTKKKLSKSIVNQMHHASLDALKNGKPLGFVINVVKNCHKAILICHENEYYWIPANYTKNDLSVSRRIGKWFSSIRFESTDNCGDWWTAYIEVRERAANHIYI